jgi:2-phosphoglycolate phosphatase
VKAGLLFDFDGTLADTFGDITEAVQRMRASLGADPLPVKHVTRHIGWGAANLIRLCHPLLDPLRPDRLPRDGGEISLTECGDMTLSISDGQPAMAGAPETIHISAADWEAARRLNREAVDQVIAENCFQTQLYPGIRDCCRRFAAQGVILAVVSNKNETVMRQLMARLGMVDDFALALGGESLPTRKPDGGPIEFAMAELGIDRQRCVMTGDTAIDIAAARNAGVKACGVSWGLATTAELESTSPDFLAHSVDEMNRYLATAIDSNTSL